MKLCRFQPLELRWQAVGRQQQEIYPQARSGIIERELVHEISGDLNRALERTGRSWPLAEVKLLPPSQPSKIVCVGRNYAEHANEMGDPPPKEPVVFLKPVSAIIAPEEPIVMPEISRRVDYEGELGVIIGRRCARLRDDEDVRPYILGYTCVNDVTARDVQKQEVQYTRAKGFDTFCPFGPVIETDLDAGDTTVETFVNGIRKQSGHTSKMIFSIGAIIRWIAQVMTLEPGDLIATGTPSGISPLAVGDIVEVVVGGIGTLRNPVTGPGAD